METQLEKAVLESSVKEQQFTECMELLANLQQSINDHGRDRDTRISTLELKVKAIKHELAAAVKELKVAYSFASVTIFLLLVLQLLDSHRY